MCIDIFAPGVSIEVPFLLEQIWLCLPENDPTQLAVTEVYDLRIRNPKGNPAIQEFFTLFPNDCAEDIGGNHGLRIETRPVTPDSYGAMDEDDRNYEWAFAKPQWVGNTGTYTSRGYCVVPPNPRGPSFQEFPGKVLNAAVGFPDVLSPNLQQIIAEAPIIKTLVSLKLSNTALGGGEEGWLRLKVKPRRLDQSGPRRRTIAPSLATSLYSQRLTATCPILVRDRLQAKLDVADKGSTPEKAAMYQDLRRIVFKDGVYAPGTGTRIIDHRVAIIACGAVDISDANCTDAALYYGTIPSQLLDQETQSGLWWGCGSARNAQYDLLENARRVLDMLTYVGQPREKIELARDLAPSGKHEAFCTLLDKMVEAGLLCRGGQGEQLRLSNMSGDVRDERMVKLRTAYAVPSVSHELLASDFFDLHAFSIDYRASWFA